MKAQKQLFGKLRMKKYEFTEAELEKLHQQYRQIYKYYTKGLENDDSITLSSIQTILAFNVYFMEAVRRILIEKNIASKEEINQMLDKVFEEEFKTMVQP